MKFGKSLNQQIQETLPEWRDKFLCYKELKKVVRLIALAAPPSVLNDGSSNDGFRKSYEAEFVYLLNNEIDKFNSFFMELEEDFIIRHKELQQRIQRGIDRWRNPVYEMRYREDMWKIRREIVNFHGEMVLLVNYSNINYTGLGKILKKYEKRTGGILRLAFIQTVTEQPFFITDQISKLVKDCENIIDTIFTIEGEDDEERRREEGGGSEGIFRNTVMALLTMQEIRRGSSTYSNLSLPPLDLPDSHLLHLLNQTKMNSSIPIL